MRRHPWLLPLAAVLTAGVCFLSVVRARDDTDKEEKAKIEAGKKAAPDVLDLANAVAKPEDLKKQVDVITKKYDELMPIMWQMKPREKGGLGVGPKPDVYPNDAIELHLLIDLGGKKGLSAKDIKAQADDLNRMNQVIRGIAAVTPSYAKKFAKTPADEKVWNGLADDMAKASDDFGAAVKSDDEKAFKTAVNNLNHSCNECHTKFRDN